ncbi:MAG TPA: hypothetical protein PKI93_01790 [Alphaproteobacteria bacterium]|nr:hypothetical protein [Alphaproteobacteria bacterium]HNS44851.1 hypothetical protein [Alphaproteobacteria bacterium]
MTQETPSAASFSHLAEEYGVWFAQIIRAVFYSKDVGQKPHSPALVDALPDIHERLKKGGVIDRLKSSQITLHDLADKMMDGGGVPTLSAFDTFWQTYEGFSVQLRRIEKDVVLSDFGIDMATGLRSSAVMVADLERELERRARKGQPFSVAMIRIDNPALRGDERVLALVSRAIQKTIRSFDDAYVSGDGEFLISLKHSDSAGGVRFVARFKSALNESGEQDFTVSSCVAEPLPGDELSDLLANVRADLDQISSQDGGAVGQHEEVSPLNRFLQSLKEEK